MKQDQSAERGALMRPPEEIVAGLTTGDRTVLARAITLIESDRVEHRVLAREVVSRCVGVTLEGTMRIAISGVPGAGKSTFIEAFGWMLCEAGHRVAVLTVDPSSSRSGGSILGDKTRMERLSRRKDCFIRTSPTGGALGGVTRRTRETIGLCEAAGYDVILVETVGVGQSEIAVHEMVDCFVLLLISGAGDELQGMKKGIVEISDIMLINKADGENRLAAEATRAELEGAAKLLRPATEGWEPPVLSMSSIEGSGLDDVWATIRNYFQHLRESGQFTTKRREQALAWYRSVLEQGLLARFRSDRSVESERVRVEQAVLAGELEPSAAAEELLDRFHPPNRPA